MRLQKESECNHEEPLEINSTHARIHEKTYPDAFRIIQNRSPKHSNIIKNEFQNALGSRLDPNWLPLLTRAPKGVFLGSAWESKSMKKYGKKHSRFE
jgi:hypothetical protein